MIVTNLIDDNDSDNDEEILHEGYQKNFVDVRGWFRKGLVAH